jgi:hypothetical protein
MIGTLDRSASAPFVQLASGEASLISSRQAVDWVSVNVTVEKFNLKETYFEGANSSF